jgi:ABC-type sugar transport system substrate-binding protein
MHEQGSRQPSEVPMHRKTVAAFVLAVSLAALAATLLARPSGAAHRRYTIADLTGNMGKAGKEEAKRLGVRLLVPKTVLLGSCCSTSGWIKIYKSMIARHVDAIISTGYDSTLEPIFKKVRKAGILLISSGDDIAGKRDLYVGYSAPPVFAHALADALASQIGKKGEYAIVDEQGEYPIAKTWKKIVEHYIPKAYPNMKLDGAPSEIPTGDQNEVDAVKGFMSAHPNLKGMISITPRETYATGEAITQAGRIGQIFAAGNGGLTPVDSQLAGYVRSGATELVYGDSNRKLAYLTVWATNYLLNGHRFRSGAYRVGGPIGQVWYYPKHQELRLDQPLIVTKKNLHHYTNP